MIGIYKIENKITHKVYIGQSSNIIERWHRHRDSILKPYPLYEAFREFGLDNFDFSVIEECKLSELNEREIFWIDYYDSYNNGYNLTRGGSGIPHSVKINNDNLLMIIYYLSETEISQNDIAEIFNVGADTISEINQGKSRRLDGIDYPIRNNRRDKRYCIDCGIEIKYGIRCKDCAYKANRKVERPDKDTLFNLLKDNNGNFSKISHIFGVTDNAIRKWCKKYELPTHSNDYKL